MAGSSSSNNWILPALLSSGISVTAILGGYWAFHQHEKYLRSKWLDEEEERQLLQQKERRANSNKESDSGDDLEENTSSAVLYSVIGHFKSLELDSTSTILEANRRRTTSYYEKAREAHEQSLVLGIPSYSKLIEKRKKALDSLLFNHREGKKSLRTVIVMLDNLTQSVLSEARQKILQPLNYSWDIYHKGVWIPQISVIPNEDMHVTVACPWWWHTMREGNDELNNELSTRLKQALVIDFHHPFFLELERFVLLGGKTLVALWRTVGERSVLEEGDDPIVVCDRHATTIDPMVRLRKEIVDCFTNDQHEHNFRPLTHHHLVKDTDTNASPVKSSNQAPPPLPKPKKIERTHTIEEKTPGLGSGDGFIHTTLCRLPLECFSTKDIELEPIHRLCREATATYSGHRMLVHKFRFVETTGEGGDSNPCKNPRFDCTLVAPLKVNNEELPFASDPNEFEDDAPLRTRALTTGRAAGLRLQARREGLDTASVGMTRSGTAGGLDGLFDPPN